MPDSGIVSWWGAITGTGGLVLAAYKTWFDKGADTRATQREARASLRECLESLEVRLKRMNSILQTGSRVPYMSAETSKEFRDLEYILARTNFISGIDQAELKSALLDVEISWNKAHYNWVEPREGDQSQVIAENRRQNDLREKIAGAIAKVKSVLGAIYRIDRGKS